ncbi:Homologous recombination OB-fold protein [Plasmodiophora brassicae]
MQRRAPGPAGEPLPSLTAATAAAFDARIRSAPRQAYDGDERRSAADLLAGSAPWRRMLETTGSNPPPTQMLSSLSRSGCSDANWKVPRLAVAVVNLDRLRHNAFATFRDLSGTMQGSIHGQVLDAHRDSIDVGAVLVLSNVTVFSPTRSNHYLNVCLANVELVVPYNMENSVGSSTVESHVRPRLGSPERADVRSFHRLVRPRLESDDGSGQRDGTGPDQAEINGKELDSPSPSVQGHADRDDLDMQGPHVGMHTTVDQACIMFERESPLNIRLSSQVAGSQGQQQQHSADRGASKIMLSSQIAPLHEFDIDALDEEALDI